MLSSLGNSKFHEKNILYILSFYLFIYLFEIYIFLPYMYIRFILHWNNSLAVNLSKKKFGYLFIRRISPTV